MEGCLLVKQTEGSNKFYLIVEGNAGIHCKYGRIELLQRGTFMAEKNYTKSLYEQKYSKLKKGYTEVFHTDGDSIAEFMEASSGWANSGAIPTGELVATEFLPWFNGGEED